MTILSIQSHVVYGYVGNKAAVYPLQSMGYDVLPVNTVQFSNHTGYGKWQGEIAAREQIRNLISGIEAIGVIDQCQAIISGYMGSREICHEVLETVQRFQSQNSEILYLCNPVIGDNNKCYVRPEVLEFFKNNLCANIIILNQFEAEVLAGIVIKNIQNLKDIANYFHDLGTAMIVITGLKIQELSVDDLYVFISDQKQYNAIRTKEYNFKIVINGTGDLFSAVFLGRYLFTRDAIESLKQTIYFTELVVKNTFDTQSRELQVTSIHYTDFDPQALANIIIL